MLLFLLRGAFHWFTPPHLPPFFLFDLFSYVGPDRRLRSTTEVVITKLREE